MGKKCLITGHTGFKGSWLSLVLNRLGADVFGISFDNRAPSGFFNEIVSVGEFKTYKIDITDGETACAVIAKIQPDYIFHLAAQALVIRGYENPQETFQTNILGTQNILEGIRQLKNQPICVFATTDKVYKNDNLGVPFSEEDELGGADPYSASKAAKEILISSYVQSFLCNLGARVGVARAGNVIGGGDWSENRLIPDIYRSWSDGSELEIRFPDATRPWQHVLEPIVGYIEFAIWLSEQPEGTFEVLNFGPKDFELHSVRSICEEAINFMPSLSIKLCEAEYHEAVSLSLNTEKMQSLIGFNPVLDFQTAIKWTFDWYVRFKTGENVESLCIRNIEDYWHEKKMV